MVLLLSKSDLQSALDMKDAIDAVEEAFREISSGTVVSPPRPYLDIREFDGGILLNAGYLKKAGYAGVKIASSYPNNKIFGLPTVASIITLHDPKTGLPTAIMEGGYLTALKTGAASGVATKYLSRENSEVVGIVGAGVQARTQLWAVCVVRQIRTALVYDIDKYRSVKFAEEMSKKLNITIHVSDNVIDVVSKPDIIVTATTSNDPVFNGAWLNEGVHINGIGSFTAEAAEIDEESFRRAGRAFIDNWEALNVGDIERAVRAKVIDRNAIYHLSEVVSGKICGRATSKDITIFKSVGGASYDVAVAAKAYEIAKKRHLGLELEL